VRVLKWSYPVDELAEPSQTSQPEGLAGAGLRVLGEEVSSWLLSSCLVGVLCGRPDGLLGRPGRVAGRPVRGSVDPSWFTSWKPHRWGAFGGFRLLCAFICPPARLVHNPEKTVVSRPMRIGTGRSATSPAGPLYRPRVVWTSSRVVGYSLVSPWMYVTATFSVRRRRRAYSGRINVTVLPESNKAVPSFPFALTGVRGALPLCWAQHAVKSPHGRPVSLV